MTEGTSSMKAICMIVTTMLGVGMYYTPYSFAQSGVLIGVSLLMAVVLATIASILSLFLSSKKLEDEDHEKGTELKTIKNGTDVVENESFIKSTENDLEKQENIKTTSLEITYSGIGKYLNPILGRVIDIMIVLSGIAACLFYQKFIGELATTLLGYTVNDEKWNLINAGFVFLSSVVLFIFAQFRDISKISWLAYVNIGIIGMIGIIILLLNLALEGFREQHTENPNKGDIGFAIGNFIFAMSCQVNVVKIFTDLSNKSTKNLILVSILAPIVCGTIYGCVGIMGALLLGENMPKIDIINYLANSNSPIRVYMKNHHTLLNCIPYITSILSMLALMISFIFNLSAVTRSINNSNFIKHKSNVSRWLIITLLVFSPITIINMIPGLDLNIIFSLIGNFISNPLAFVFPLIFVAFLFGKKNKLIKYLFYLGVAGSVIFGVVNTYFSFADNSHPLTNSTIIADNTTSQPLRN